jgi:hypothetical protein
MAEQNGVLSPAHKKTPAWNFQRRCFQAADNLGQIRQNTSCFRLSAYGLFKSVDQAEQTR